MKKRLGLASACAAGILVPCLLLIDTARAVPVDEVFTPLTAVTVSTPGRPLKSFDISYVDQGGVKICYRSKCWLTPPRYLLADRSNGAIDVIDPVLNTALSPLVPQLAFAGNVPSPPANLSGPNGVI